MKRWRIRTICVGVALAWLSLPSRLGAEPLELMPSYAKGMQEDATLRSVAFGGHEVGIACGDRGVILRSLDGGRSWDRQASDVQCALTDVLWVNERRVIVVGGSYDRITGISRGVVLRSDDAGVTWNRIPDDELPRLRRIEMADQKIVASGDLSFSLLTRTFESRDGGRHWNAADAADASPTSVRQPTTSELFQWVQASGVSVAIRDACRIGDHAICAVGDHGVIVRSADQGQTWQTTRGQQRRTAVAFLARDPASVPWSVLGSEALEGRHRVALLLTDGVSRSPAYMDQVRQVVTMFGGAAADLVQRDPDADHAKIAHQWMSIHRPLVLVIDDRLGGEVRDAFVQAATETGVRRIVACSTQATGRTTTLYQQAILRDCGVLASDLSADAFHFLAPYRKPASEVALTNLYNVAPSAGAGSLTDGIHMAAGYRLSSPPRQASRRKLQVVQARLKQSDRRDEIMRSTQSRDQFSDALTRMMDQTAREDQFRLIWAMLLETSTSSSTDSWKRVEYQEAALEILASRFTQTSAARWATLRLESMGHSAEWRRLRSALAQDPGQDSELASTETVPVSPFQVPPASNGVRQVAAVSPVVVPAGQPQQLKPSSSKETVDLAWEFHPLVLISRDAARRRSDDGKLQPSGVQSANLQRLAETDQSEWAELARTQGRRVLVARQTGERPKLDGRADDSCWQLALPSAGQKLQPQVAYDDDFVYLLIKFPESRMRADRFSRERPSFVRDQDLQTVDRMQLRIDTDRDLVTSMDLQVTDAGRTRDAIDGVDVWQPTWYVATHRDREHVVFELAIQRRDLVDLPISPGESWFLSAMPLAAGDEGETQAIVDPKQWQRVVFGGQRRRPKRLAE